MADPYADLASATPGMQQAIADAMEARAADPVQAEIRAAYLSEINPPPGGHAIELGSGTGHVTRDLIEIAGAGTALGLEPSPVLIERAKERHGDVAGLTFQLGDARATGLDGASADLVLMHTLLCHVPGPADALAEALRLLKPGGQLVVFDGDYDTATCAIDDHDPLQQVVAFIIGENVTNRWIMRRFALMLVELGFEVGRRRVHAYLVDTDAALRDEAWSRVERGAFFGFMSYVSVFAQKPEHAA